MVDALERLDPRRATSARSRGPVPRRQKTFVVRALRRKPWSTGCKDRLPTDLTNAPAELSVLQKQAGRPGTCSVGTRSCEMPLRRVPAQRRTSSSHPPVRLPFGTLSLVRHVFGPVRSPRSAALPRRCTQERRHERVAVCACPRVAGRQSPGRRLRLLQPDLRTVQNDDAHRPPPLRGRIRHPDGRRRPAPRPGPAVRRLAGADVHPGYRRPRTPTPDRHAGRIDPAGPRGPDPATPDGSRSGRRLQPAAAAPLDSCASGR